MEFIASTNAIEVTNFIVGTLVINSFFFFLDYSGLKCYIVHRISEGHKLWRSYRLQR